MRRADRSPPGARSLWPHAIIRPPTVMASTAATKDFYEPSPRRLPRGVPAPIGPAATRSKRLAGMTNEQPNAQASHAPALAHHAHDHAHRGSAPGSPDSSTGT